MDWRAAECCCTTTSKDKQISTSLTSSVRMSAEKFRVPGSEDEEAMASAERGNFDAEDFKEKVDSMSTDFDRRNFPASNWANHCWYDMI